MRGLLRLLRLATALAYAAACCPVIAHAAGHLIIEIHHHDDHDDDDRAAHPHGDERHEFLRPAGDAILTSAVSEFRIDGQAVAVEFAKPAAAQADIAEFAATAAGPPSESPGRIHKHAGRSPPKRA